MNLLKSLGNNLGYILLIAFITTRMRIFKRTIVKEKFKRWDLVLLSIVFGCFGILGTYTGTEINGAIANTRMIGVFTGGFLCGPLVGIVSGIIAGVHRLLMGTGAVTAVPCAIGTVISGICAGYLNKIVKKNKVIFGFIGGVALESVEMMLILLMVRPFELSTNIIKYIYIPMAFTNAIGIGVLIALINSIINEKEDIAAKQSQIALDIANKTLPHFRDLNEESYRNICTIIKEYTDVDAVAITDKERILAHVGLGEDHHTQGETLRTGATLRVIKEGVISELNSKKEINCDNSECPLKSAVIAPLKVEDEIIGTLKIYYGRENKISNTNRSLIRGLSQLISTQIEISKVAKLEDMANKAEIKALQAQINPHFMFNALNTIVSFIRINPDKARELIINLSTYLRYNIENVASLSSLEEELQQVRAYVEIEKARFGEKLKVKYEINCETRYKIPSLLIQPLVENAVKHGRMRSSNSAEVVIHVYEVDNDKIHICVEDDGEGIPQKVIDDLFTENISRNKIGMANVHNRLRYLYGEGLNITRGGIGTKVSFEISKEEIR